MSTFGRLYDNKFQVHGVDDHGRTVLRKQLRRREMEKYFGNLEPCQVSMQAWQFTSLGKKIRRIWAHRQTHVTPVCQTLREDEDENMTWQVRKRFVKQ